MKRKMQGKIGIAWLKIDISKVYDRHEWNFIEDMIKKFDFSYVWINRLIGYIRSVSSSFVHNGVVFGDVRLNQGVRQGDPTSPYIFILCAEGLSAIIQRNEEIDLIHGCIIARGAPAISYILFADGCYLFFKATGPDAIVMKNILTRYEFISGQSIN